MTDVSKYVDVDGDLTVICVSGHVGFAEAVQLVEGLYTDGPTRDVIWDCTRADLSSLTQAHMVSLARLVRYYAHPRGSGRTAFVVERDVDFGLVRMYELMAKGMDHPIEYSAFRDIAAAREWLRPLPSEAPRHGSEGHARS